MSEEERREIYDNVYSKLLTLLARCQKYVQHLNNKIKLTLTEHGQPKKVKKQVDAEQDNGTDDDMKRTGLLKKYYDMNDKDIQGRQPKLFVGSLKPCKSFSFLFRLNKIKTLYFLLCSYRSISWS